MWAQSWLVKGYLLYIWLRSRVRAHWSEGFCANQATILFCLLREWCHNGLWSALHNGVGRILAIMVEPYNSDARS